MLGNTLRAFELLKTKGIRYETRENWDKIGEMLPCTGQKHYEPNNSWLQNKQIEKGLEDRKNLLSIERVERSSNLAGAEWLPQESRARVTKKSGQEWTNFGSEENLELYLIPEEALLLLELNCLELTWEGVPLSIQQAYDVLLEQDQSKCNIDEYRVYSHLVRQGYRLQRFLYPDDSAPCDRSIRSWRSSTLKRKKLVHSPLAGFGMTRGLVNMDHEDELIKNDSTVPTEELNQLGQVCNTVNNSNDDQVMRDNQTPQKLRECQTKNDLSMDVDNKSEGTIQNGTETDTCSDGMRNGFGDCGHTESNQLTGYEQGNAGRAIDVVIQPSLETETHPLDDSIKDTKILPSKIYDNGAVNLPGPSNVKTDDTVNKIGKPSKLQVISDEIFIGDVRIMSKWPGTRIQRNVKWMPKRDVCKAKSLTMDNSCNKIRDFITQNVTSVDSVKQKSIEMSSSSGMHTVVENIKGRKRAMQEVIEISDDEIEEVPQKLSRMEMLNLFPNIMSEELVLKPISKKYLPRNISPQMPSIILAQWKIRKQDNRRESNVYGNVYGSSGAQNSSNTRRSTSPTSKNESSRKNICPMSSNFRRWPACTQPGLISNRHSVWHNDTVPFHNFEGTSLNRRNELSWQGLRLCRDLIERKMAYQRYSNQTTSRMIQTQNEMCTEQKRISVTRNISGRSQLSNHTVLHRQNIWSNTSYYYSRQNLINFEPHSFNDGALRSNYLSRVPTNNPRKMLNNTKYSYKNNHSNKRTKLGVSSFKKVPGATSWVETKAKWLDDKTITIEDEDCADNEDSMIDESEVKVLAQSVKPLVNLKNATSVAEVYKNLQIIKQATNKDVTHTRKQKISHYKISYNLYSTGQHYRKANPGSPMYRIVVFRSEHTPFIELLDIVRLQQDSKEVPILLACVSQTSVTFAELGPVRIPDIQNI